MIVHSLDTDVDSAPWHGQFTLSLGKVFRSFGRRKLLEKLRHEQRPGDRCAAHRRPLSEF